MTLRALKVIMGDDVEPLIPLSLQEWRDFEFRIDTSMRGPWDRLEPWFRRHGLRLFHGGFSTATAPNQIPRTPDGIVYSNPKNPPFNWYQHFKAIHYYARNESGHDVLIRLIKKGEDGKEELDILKHVCTGHDAFLGENHCLPMLRQLSVGDMTFGVFPVMCEGFSTPWYRSVSEVFDAIIQLLEGLIFLHGNLIAHRDIGQENILVNYIGGNRSETAERSFRSMFPIRYYYIDFELSVRFSPDSNPDDRVVSGIPISRRGYENPDDYGRDLAPEIASNEPYDPFKADVFQLGSLFFNYFKHLGNDMPGFKEILEEMIHHDPRSRPTASETLEAVRAYESSLTRAQLRRSAGEEPDVFSRSTSEHERWQQAADERWEARMEATFDRREEIAQMFPREDLDPSVSPSVLDSACRNETQASKGLDGTPRVKMITTDSRTKLHEIESLPNAELLAEAAIAPPLRPPANPATDAGLNVYHFVFHLALSLLMWCLILGPLR